MAVADILGFGNLAPVAKARPVIQAVSVALHGIPGPARLKLANAQFGTHRCSGSPHQIPAAVQLHHRDQRSGHCFAHRRRALVGAAWGDVRNGPLGPAQGGCRRPEKSPDAAAPLGRPHLARANPDGSPRRWLLAALSYAEGRRAELEHVRRHGPAQIAFLTALIGLLRDFARLIEGRHRDRVAPPIPTAGTGVILKRPKELDADERVPRSSTERAVPEVSTLLDFDRDDASLAEPVQRELAVAAATAALETEAPQTVAKFDDRRTAYRIAEIGQTLRWSWDHLNTFELDVLVRSGVAGINGSSPMAANALFALLALSTGMRVSTLAGTAIGSGELAAEHFEPSGIWVKPVRRPPQAFTPEPPQRALLVDSKSHVRFPLPQPVASALAKATTLRPSARSVGELVGCSADSAVEFVSAWLEPLRRSHPNARLTHGRISAALAVEVSAITQDEAMVHYVAGSDEDVPPIAAYYAAIPIGTLHRPYSRACRQLFGAGHEAVDPASAPNQYAGSQLLPKPEVLRSFVTGLKERVKRAAPRDLVETHNAYCLYTLWMLMAATGHRPVTDPAESLDGIDLDGGWIVVNDKQSHPGKAGRLLPLAPMVTAQLRRYLDHLHSLIAVFQAFAPELAAKLGCVVSPSGPRAMPLFFLLPSNGANWKRIGAAELGRSLDHLAGLPQNVLRHTLAATGVGQHWDPELLREMLGHIEHNVPAFGSTSTRSPQAFAALRESFNVETPERRGLASVGERVAAHDDSHESRGVTAPEYARADSNSVPRFAPRQRKSVFPTRDRP